MKIPIINEDETINETAIILNERYHYKTIPNVNLKDCSIYQRGKYIVLEYDNVIYHREVIGNYCYIENALHWMNPDKPGKWKTLERLITFRQAIRECTAQGMGLEDLYQIKDLSLNQYNKFIKTARFFDERHHGSVTF